MIYRKIYKKGIKYKQKNAYNIKMAATKKTDLYTTKRANNRKIISPVTKYG